MDYGKNSQFARIENTDFDVAKDDPDIRNWTVATRDGRSLGRVDDLIVDTSARKVRYLEVQVKDDVKGSAHESAYLPIADVDLDTRNHRVVLRSGSLDSVTDRPPAEMRSLLGTRARATDTRGSDRLTRSEEEVRIGKREVQAGEAVIGKHVETEHVRESVPVSKEKVHVERRPIEGGPASGIGASNDEIRVPIMEEEPVVDTRAVAKEEVIISKERVQENEPVDTEVRKERFDIEERNLRDRKPPTRRGGE